ncbi:response regulator [Tundrisphaera sp. TA3]|uniref:response regulator n=1 Tax=Tundrisphaera sp. TA3 TaxID=3435775 RepID=UPI003EBAB163
MSTPQPPDPAPGRPSILLVDDHAAGRVALARMLTAHGFAVTDVEDGTSAFALLRDGPPPDYLLTDLRLPDFDGREVISAARLLHPTPRIALMTGWDVDPDERDRLGIDWVFLKPLDIGQIVANFREKAPHPADRRSEAG